MHAALAVTVPVDSAQTDLALTASLAAIELDGRLRGATAPLSATERLVHLLRHVLELDASVQTAPPVCGAPPAGPAGLVDPATAGLLTRALADVGAPHATLPELAQQTEALLERLERLDAAGDAGPPSTQELQQLRAFCLAVSQSAQAEMPWAFGWSDYPDFG